MDVPNLNQFVVASESDVCAVSEALFKRAVKRTRFLAFFLLVRCRLTDSVAVGGLCSLVVEEWCQVDGVRLAPNRS